MTDNCNNCPPPFGTEGVLNNADSIPVPGGYSPQEKIIYAETLDCYCKPMDIANMRQLFLLLAQSHWANSQNFGPHIAGLECLTFTRESDSALQIRLDSDYNQSDTFNKPSIYVSIDRMAFQRLSQDNRDAFSDDLGTAYRSWVTASTLTLAHYHAASDIAFKMADNSMYFLLGVMEPIMAKLPIPKYDPIDVGPLQIIEKGPDRCFRVDAKILINCHYNVSTSIESSRLKQFALEMAPK